MYLISLVIFNMEHFLHLSLIFITLLLMITDQLFCKISLDLGLSNFFFLD